MAVQDHSTGTTLRPIQSERKAPKNHCLHCFNCTACLDLEVALKTGDLGVEANGVLDQRPRYRRSGGACTALGAICSRGVHHGFYLNIPPHPP
jgi:hypothetical protein